MSSTSKSKVQSKVKTKNKSKEKSDTDDESIEVKESKVKSKSKESIEENENIKIKEFEDIIKLYSSKKFTKNMNKIRKNKSQVTELKFDVPIQIFFTNIESVLTSGIKNATYIIGCTAWLTNSIILKALSEKLGVKMIINKECYLNSDSEYGEGRFYSLLRSAYRKIKDLSLISCEQLNQLIPNFKICQEEKIDRTGAILTCGIVNSRCKLHHKFMIFFDDNFKPIGLWSGSYNFSNNSNFCLENGIYITDQNVIKQYIDEFNSIYSYSETFDWSNGLLPKKV